MKVEAVEISHKIQHLSKKATIGVHVPPLATIKKWSSLKFELKWKFKLLEV